MSAGHVAALAGLPRMGPRRLRALLARWSPEQAWDRVRRGVVARDARLLVRTGPLEAVAAGWSRAAADIDPVAVAQRHRDLGVGIAWEGEPTEAVAGRRSGTGYPRRLVGDVEPPAVVFWRGDLGLVEHRPLVAVVGTRRCTPTGAAVARDLGAELARAGVGVVSGLASGIDAAAHRGALAADGPVGPVGVVATGLDVVYPASSREVWDAVAHRGVVVSEAPLGVRPARWRFPARNRILAALVDAVVVVESRPRGGSLLTVDEALRRSVPVLAVPGSVRNPAAGGTNQLIFDGCPPARDALDVLSALGVEVARADGAPDVVDDPVLSAVGSDPASFEEIALRSDRDVAEVSLALQRLVDLGLVAVQEGWYCRVG